MMKPIVLNKGDYDRMKYFCRLFVEIYAMDLEEKFEQLQPFYKLNKTVEPRTKVFKNQVPLELFIYKLLTSEEKSANKVEQAILDNFIKEFQRYYLGSRKPEYNFEDFFSTYINTIKYNIKESEYNEWEKKHGPKVDRDNEYYASAHKGEELWTYYLMQVLKQPIFIPKIYVFGSEKDKEILPRATMAMVRLVEELKEGIIKQAKKSVAVPVPVPVAAAPVKKAVKKPVPVPAHAKSPVKELDPNEYILRFEKNKDGFNELKRYTLAKDGKKKESEVIVKIPTELNVAKCTQATLIKHIKEVAASSMLSKLTFPKTLSEQSMQKLCNDAKSIAKSIAKN